jgi:hypothetical protein
MMTGCGGNMKWSRATVQILVHPAPGYLEGLNGVGLWGHVASLL